MLNKILLSGIQPSGKPHIGNYFGMMKQMVDLQDEYETRVFIVDYHALTTLKNKAKMKQGILDVALDFLAIGLDPEKVIFFKQSDVPEHTELAWVLNCLTPAQMMMTAHAFKDAQKSGSKETSVGLLTYPVLQAADILLYGTNIVPVGEDQKQHIEITREIARKFNNLYGETFIEPKAMIKEEVGLILGSDGRKMSKSYGNHLPLFATEKETEKYIMSIPMDSKKIEEKKNPDDYDLYKIFKLFATEEEDKEVRRMFEAGGTGYADIKKYTAQKINKYLKDMRTRREELSQNKSKVLEILKAGGEKAKKIASAKMQEVKEKIGVSLY